MQSILKFSNKASYSTLRTHQKTCTQVPIPGACHVHEKMLQPQTTFRGAHIPARPKEKHAELSASLITFYPICIDVQTDAMKPHQPYPWTIGSMESAIANAVPTL